MSEANLKPCPFCGVQPEIEDRNGHWKDVACLNVHCLVQPRALDCSVISAFETWNRRPVTPPAADEFEETRKELNRILNSLALELPTELHGCISLQIVALFESARASITVEDFEQWFDHRGTWGASLAVQEQFRECWNAARAPLTAELEQVRFNYRDAEGRYEACYAELCRVNNLRSDLESLLLVADEALKVSDGWLYGHYNQEGQAARRARNNEVREQIAAYREGEK